MIIDARAVKVSVPLTTLTIGVAVTAWHTDIRRLEGFLIGSALAVLVDWATEFLWEWHRTSGHTAARSRHENHWPTVDPKDS